MKILTFIIALLGFVFIGSAQIPEVKKKDSCYFNFDSSGKRVSSRRYAEWECGKLVGVVDCGSKLEYDQDADLVYLNNQDMVNATGAGKPFTGTCESCHMNGVLERRITFVNGKENGYYLL